MSVAKRISWIDSSRGIAFLMVIFNHLDYENNIVMRFFAPIFLTSFFFVSGYLFKSDVSFKDIFMHRTRTLLWPFFILGNITILSSCFVSFNEKHIGILESYKELFAQYGYAHINTMWFIPSLYLYSIGFYLLLIIRNRYIRHTLFILFLLLNWYFYYYVFVEFSLPWNVQWMGFAWFYMYLGVLYRYNEGFVDQFAKFPFFVFLLIFYVGYIIITNNSCNFYGSPLLFDSCALSLSGLFLLISLCKKINIHFFKFVGANTLLYFAFHGKVASFVNVLYRHMFIEDINNLIVYEIILIIKTILIALLLIPICKIVNKYFPFILGRTNYIFKSH